LEVKDAIEKNTQLKGINFETNIEDGKKTIQSLSEKNETELNSFPMPSILTLITDFIFHKSNNITTLNSPEKDASDLSKSTKDAAENKYIMMIPMNSSELENDEMKEDVVENRIKTAGISNQMKSKYIGTTNKKVLLNATKKMDDVNNSFNEFKKHQDPLTSFNIDEIKMTSVINGDENKIEDIKMIPDKSEEGHVEDEINQSKVSPLEVSKRANNTFIEMSSKDISKDQKNDNDINNSFDIENNPKTTGMLKFLYISN
jgi:hypothetical protein